MLKSSAADLLFVVKAKPFQDYYAISETCKHCVYMSLTIFNPFTFIMFTKSITNQYSKSSAAD